MNLSIDKTNCTHSHARVREGGGLMQQETGVGWAERRARKDIDTYTYPVVVCAVDVPGHAKVPNLYQQVLTHQTVPAKKLRKKYSEISNFLYLS